MNSENYIFTIAIDKYNGTDFKVLNNAKHDARALTRVLCDRYGFKIINPLFDRNATRRKIIEAINDLTSHVHENDSLIVYFAGHGMIHPINQIGYWIPVDAKRSVGDWISNQELLAYLTGINVKHLVLVSDSCFSGALLKNTRGSENTLHYMKLKEKRSRYIITSGRLEVVDDGKPGKGSPFANALVDSLFQNSQTYFSITDLFNQVQKVVASSNSQQPDYNIIPNCGHEGGQLVFQISTEKKVLSSKKRTWEENFLIFCELKKTREEWPYISKMNPETKEIGIWCQEQRVARKKNKLLPSREKKLIEVKFSFDPTLDKFFSGLTKFLIFKNKTGLNDVPAKLLNEYKSEDAWHRQQQKLYAKTPCDPNNPKSYPMYRYEILLKNDIPIELNLRTEQWEKFKEELIHFYKTHERIVTLPNQNDKDKKIAELGQRVNDYMVNWKRGRLSPEKIKFLSDYIDINYEKNKHKRELELQIQKYLAFREEFPGENPSTEERKRPDVKWILNWKATTRKRYSGDTSEENKWRINRLNQINFPWYSNDKRKGGTNGKQTTLWS